MSRTTLGRRLKENPHIRPIRAGRNLWFYPADVAALEEALRPCPSTFLPPANASRPSRESGTSIAITTSAAKSPVGLLTSQRRQRTLQQLRRLRQPSNSTPSATLRPPSATM